MPTFDIVSKIDGQTLDNAINTAKKEILNRYDFNDSKVLSIWIKNQRYNLCY